MLIRVFGNKTGELYVFMIACSPVGSEMGKLSLRFNEARFLCIFTTYL